MQNAEEASLNISPAGRGQIVKMLLTLEQHGPLVYFDQNLLTYIF